MTKHLKREEITITVVPLDWEQTLGVVSAVLLRSLERHTGTPWRLVCPTVAVERVEPYRTLVLNTGALQALLEQQQLWSERKMGYVLQEGADLPKGDITSDDTLLAPPFQFTTEFYAPLSPESQSLQQGLVPVGENTLKQVAIS